jgi:hypothetical protein
MKIQDVNIDMISFGARFANLSDDEQAEFFQGFARELSLWDSAYMAQLQMDSVSQKLDEKEKKTLESALGQLWFKGE